MKFSKTLISSLTSLLMLCLLGMVTSCSVVNPNYKIAGKYELRIDPQDNSKDNNKGLGNFIGKTILKNLFKTDVEFHLDGTTDLDIDVFGVNLGDIEETFTYSIKNGNTLILHSEDEETSFKMTTTEDGFELKNDDITLYLKKKKEKE